MTKFGGLPFPHPSSFVCEDVLFFLSEVLPTIPGRSSDHGMYVRSAQVPANKAPTIPMIIFEDALRMKLVGWFETLSAW